MLKLIALLGAMTALTSCSDERRFFARQDFCCEERRFFPRPIFCCERPFIPRPIFCCERPFIPRPVFCCEDRPFFHRPYGYGRPLYYYGDRFAPYAYNWNAGYNDAGYGYDWNGGYTNAGYGYY